MQKLDMKTPNITEKNIENIAKLFPNVITEKEDSKTGKIIKAIDFDLLKQQLSKEIVEGCEERYTLNWPGKKASLLKANTPIEKTLRPCREDSVDFDTTENLYIEGDNFEVLKILQESYLGKVKMIYIDPPYNTGKDFVYKDNFTKSKADADEEAGVEDEDGGKLFKNTDTNGRFHSDWLSMMYERLTVARDLLKDDGVIFMSIDDNEVDNLRKIADEIFGEENFIANVIWEKNFAPKNNNKHFSENHDYILCFSKNIEKTNRHLLPFDEEQKNRYKNIDNDPRGVWQSDNITVAGNNSKNSYEIKTPSGRIITPPPGRSWGFNKDKLNILIEDNRIWFGEDGNNVPRYKRFFSEVQSGKVPYTIWKHSEVGHTQDSKQKLIKLFEKKATFDTPKPVELITKMLKLYSNKDSIILDFFSGSATTAHATMQLNAEDGGNRKFIMVQIPEETDEKSEAFKAGYKNICEIGKERIRRAGKKIVEENKEKLKERKEKGIKDLDIGFRVYKTDSSNMKDVFYHPSELKQSSLFDVISNIKEDRSSEDLLTQVILDLGLTLDMPIEKKEILGNTVYFVAGNSLVACFDKNISCEVISKILNKNPKKVVFKDGCFRSDSQMINCKNNVNKLEGESDIRVI